MRHFVSLPFALITALGCSNSHAIGTDGSVPADADGCTGFAPQCVMHCGDDWLMSATCVDDRWQCPEDWQPWENCECSGPACGSDAGVDGGGCPSDWHAAEGTACPSEGQHCGTCSAPCAWCNLLTCNGGRWTRLEAYPPDECTAFACGPALQCHAVTQYCQHSTSDIGGEPEGYRCRPYPDSCTSCDCLGGNECEGDAETGITVTYYGG